jgi:ceramide glucosyltransferase
VTFAAVFPAMAAAWWTCSIAVLLLSFLAALAYPLHKLPSNTPVNSPPLTAIVPIKHLHAGFVEALSSLFQQNYDGLEIIIAAAERESPAIDAARRIQTAFPSVSSRMIHSVCATAASPKLNNLWPALVAANNDLVLTKDSNLCLENGDLQELVRHLAPGTGLVSSISIATHPGSFAAWIEASIINCYHARVLMLADAAGFGFGLGKIMLFRRSDLIRAGGFDRVAWALGEDQALANAIAGLGLRTVLADRVSHQVLGSRRLSEMWQRQLRWMIIWRVQLPAAYFGDLLGSAIPTAVAGALAARAAGFAPMQVAAATLAVWLCVESILCFAKGWPISLWSPFAFLAREILTPLLWLRACTTAEVAWGGTVYSAARKSNDLRPPCPDARRSTTHDIKK